MKAKNGQIKRAAKQDVFVDHEGQKILAWSREGHFYVGLAIDPKNVRKVKALYVANGQNLVTKLISNFKPTETSLPPFNFSGAPRKDAEAYLFSILSLRYWDFIIELHEATGGKDPVWTPEDVKKRGPRGWA